ncbi:MAG: zf-HC2 domain-containing protein [Ilumatobacteraceae bacterium]
MDMACDRWQQAISAIADGEDPGVEPRLLDAHLATCPSCRAFAEFSRSAAPVLVAAPDMPDLARPVTKRNAIADRAASLSIARVLLGVVALEVIVFSLRALVWGKESDTSVHAARHLGAFSVAYAVGLLVVVVRPARARTMLPVAFVLAGALALTALIDIATGHVPLINETTHIPELVSVLLLWLLAVPSDRRRLQRAAPPSTPLRAVHSHDDPPRRAASGG